MIKTDRAISPHLSFEELSQAATQWIHLRPQTLSAYRGQEKLKAQLAVFIEAAKQRREPLDHLLLYGPPGLGKTTLAQIVAHELGVLFKSTSGPVLEKPGDLAALLTNLSPNEVLFIDEIHRLSPAIEEILYPAMEDRQLDLVIGEGPSARSIKLDLAPFTLIGATTRAGLLTAPLRDRFGITGRLNFYASEALATILQDNAERLGCTLSKEASLELAQRARGTPRIANRLLKRARDVASLKQMDNLTVTLVKETLALLEVDQAGFDAQDTQLLRTLIDQFRGGPVGIETLASTLGESWHTLVEVIEPYLLQANYLIRTARGRCATEKAYRHFGLQPPEELDSKISS